MSYTKYYNIYYSVKCFITEISKTLFFFIYYKIFYSIEYYQKDIVFFCGYGNMPGNIKWDGNSKENGIGGSESCIINLAEELIKTNNSVIVYCDCKHDIIINNVKYINSSQFNYNTNYKNLILWRVPFIQYFTKANNKILWIHDGSLIPVLNFFYKIKLLNYFIDPIFKIVIPSKYMYNILTNYNIYSDIYLIKNGIESISSNITISNNNRIENSFIWHTNIYRGLDELLNNFHKITQVFPNSKIYICGSTSSYNNDSYMNDLFKKYKDYIVLLGTQSHDSVIQLLHKYDIFLYPVNIIESFSLCTWEAAIYGCIPIVYNYGAISEIKEVGGIIVDNNNIDMLISKCLHLLKNKNAKEKLRNKIKNNCIDCFWPDIVKKWKLII